MTIYSAHDGISERIYRTDRDCTVSYASDTGHSIGEHLWTQELGEVEIVEMCQHLPYGQRLYRVRVLGEGEGTS